MTGSDPFEANEFVLRTEEELHVRVERSGRALTAEQQKLGRLALLALQLGFDGNDPQLARATRAIVASLLDLETGSLGTEAANALDSAHVASVLEQALFTGRLVVSRIRVDSLSGVQLLLPELPPAPPTKDDETTFFEVKWLDEIGKPIGGVPVVYDVDGETKEVSTNGAGIALFENALSSSGTIAAPDVKALEKALEQRWLKPRAGTAPREKNMTEILFQGAPVGPLSVKAVVTNNVVLKPPLGRLFVQLFDKTGRARHAERPYEIAGPMKFSGKTDALGMLLHDEVFHGDYTLTLKVETPDGDGVQTDTYESPLVVLAKGAAEPLTRQLGVVPFSVLARLKFFFNTNKTFLLPTALPGFLLLRKLYLENNPSDLLVVGHADTAGDASANDKLSLDRARSVVAFLKDDVDTWLDFYGTGTPEKQRWGAPEDRMMLVAMPDFAMKPKGEDAVRWFQSTRGLSVDGKAGPETRRQLITEYMALDGATITAPGLSISLTAHGCGENFPLDAAGELDATPKPDAHEPEDRRVELFFFDKEFGILPKPPGETSAAGSSEYPAWRKSVIETHDIDASAFPGPEVTFIELMDAHFRTNSAVVLPEGEAPSGDASEALTSAGVFAQALRFSTDNPEKKLLVAGHADTTASVEFNQPLSEERARCALALLVGDRESFKSVCDARHQVADYKQILAWIAQAFEGLGFDCHPGKVDDVEQTGVEPVRRFQQAYNTNKPALDATGPDLALDGDVGPLTWGAFYDCYEFALREELGVDAARLQSLRDRLVFVDDARKSLGFSEHFPIEELGVDNFKSQSNRRVELLFFDPTEEPDLAEAEADPETAILYLPGQYVMTPISAGSVKDWRASWDAKTVGFAETRKMLLRAPGLPAGTPLTWTLRLEDDTELAVLESTSDVDGASLEIDDFAFPEMFTGELTLEAGEEFEPVLFKFSVEGGGRSAESEGSLLYTDSLRTRVSVEVTSDEVVFPEAMAYVVHTLAGSRSGTTQTINDEAGWVVEEGLPPGGSTLVVEDIEALRFA